MFVRARIFFKKDGIFKQYDQKYIIASIHKLHLLEMFDEIIVMDHGKIIEVGGFTDLLAKPGGALAGLRKEYEAVI